MWYAFQVNYGIHTRAKTLYEIRLALGVRYIDGVGLKRIGKGRYEYKGKYFIYHGADSAKINGWGWAFAINRIPEKSKWIKVK